MAQSLNAGHPPTHLQKACFLLQPRGALASWSPEDVLTLARDLASAHLFRPL